jgi:pyruvate kinase
MRGEQNVIKPINKTKIVCTIGPASESPDSIRQLLLAGMDIARLNLSHGDFAWHKTVIETLRAMALEVEKPVTIMADLPGLKIRIGQLDEEPIEVLRGDSLVLTIVEGVSNRHHVFVSFPRLPEIVGLGNILLLNDGEIQLEVVNIEATDVTCRVLVGGELRSRKGLNLPGVNLGIGAFTKHDRDCLKFALENGVDAISQSFVETAADVFSVRNAATELGFQPFIIAKIERAGALLHIDEILNAADGIMIARGDLGVETPLERIAVVQKQLISRANMLGKPVITATQMLESMVDHYHPTRAEATDVANAILDGTDCVMLSEESASGRFPVEAVTMLVKIAVETEPYRTGKSGVTVCSTNAFKYGSGVSKYVDCCDQVVFSTVDSAVAAATVAQAAFQGESLKVRCAVIEALRSISIANAELWGEMAVEETKMGRVSDKAQKNILCATRTPGVEDLHSHAYTGDKGLTLVEYAPFGVVAAVTPSNNPAATIISNSIAILSAGNAVVFAPHPGAARVCHAVMCALAAAAVSAGAPAGLITTIYPPSHETTEALLSHPGVHLNLVTGGPEIVKLAMTTGKICKTIAAGPGNPPVVVDDTAHFPACSEEIIFGASFDNNLLCIAEKEVIVVEAAKLRFLESMRNDSRAYELTTAQMDAVAALVIIEGEGGGTERYVNRNYVGRDAAVIAKGIGLEVPSATRLLWGEVPGDHLLIVTEQLMPVLPVTFVPDVDAAISLACHAEAGNHHTAAMYSTNIDNLTKMGRRMHCSIFVNNASTLYGLGMGEGHTSMSIGTPTGDGITKPSHFARPLHCSFVDSFRIV